MASIRDLWPDRWLKAHHLADKRPTVAIESVTVEPLYNPRTKREEPKLIVAFYRKTLRLILNKTQAQTLAQITQTDDYMRWVGQRVVLSAGTAPNGAPTIVISPVPDPAPAPSPTADDEDTPSLDDATPDELWDRPEPEP